MYLGFHSGKEPLVGGDEIEPQSSGQTKDIFE